MARKAWPKASGANPAIKTPKAPADTRMHRRVVISNGDSPRDGFEVWTRCGLETTEHGARTTYITADVTCGACAGIAR